jgi:HSP20 family protein
MSTIVRTSDKPAAPAVGQWDPFRAMRDLLRWDPFREMSAFEPYGGAETAMFMPAFEVKETKEGYSFKADLPGVKDADLEITLSGNRMTISGKREAEQREKSDTFYAYERTYGSFARTFTLPEGADMENLHAELKGGVLTMLVPRRPEMQPRKIQIKTDTAKKS